jgi:hypothetical protein
MPYLSIEQMRKDISNVYSGEMWKKKVARMPEDQVFAIYNRFLNQGKFRKKDGQKSKNSWPSLKNENGQMAAKVGKSPVSDEDVPYQMTFADIFYP